MIAIRMVSSIVYAGCIAGIFGIAPHLGGTMSVDSLVTALIVLLVLAFAVIGWLMADRNKKP